MLELLRRRSFGALTTTQFLGAFNDNAFKQFVLLLVVTGALPWVGESELARRGGQALPQFLFAIPFVLLGALTGSLADRCSKSAIVRAANLLEVAVMAGALAAFLLESYPLLLAAVLLMGAQSALFGPSKYGAIPELVEPGALSRANALIQMTTMVAIVLGMALAGFLYRWLAADLLGAGLFFVAFALLGFLASLRIERLAPADPARRLSGWVPGELAAGARAIRGDRTLAPAIAASALFYLIGATLVPIVNAHGHAVLRLDTVGIAALQALVAMGVAAGALLAGRLSGEGIEGGLIPLGLLGMAASLASVQLAPSSTPLAGAALFGFGASAGVFSVPVRALVQSRPRAAARGRVLGFSQTLDFSGIVAAAGLYWLLAIGLELSPPAMLLVLAGALLVFLGVALATSAELALRLLLLLLVRALYRLRVRGLEHLPRGGGALLVANHQSFVDALLIGAAARRPVRFLMHRGYFELPLVGWFARRMGTIPVARGDGRGAQREALERAAASARAGELVCIFAEGALTRTGALLPFARGMERIARAAGVPIVPVALDRLWGSIFSFEQGRLFWKWPRSLPFPVDLDFGGPMEPETPAWQVRRRIQETIAELRGRRGGARDSLAWRFVLSAKAHARHPAVVDGTGTRLSYRRLLVAALAMRARLSARLEPAERVAVLLPPSAAGAIVNVALVLAGRTSVNLNYTMSNEALAGPLERAGVRQLLSSRRFLKALGRPAPLPEERTLYVEDLAREIGRGAKLRALALALLPATLLARRVAPRVEAGAVATVIFSSGSTGEPKGVQLTHGNVLSNVQSVLELVRIAPGDAMLGVLPFFHAFGYTVTLWTNLLAGAKGVFHANPLDAQKIGELCAAERVTLAVATPTFYQSYLRRIAPEQLAHLRIALAGAEKLRPELAAAWEERFGLPLLEGYGATECGPVVAFNVPDVELGGRRERGHKPGTIGRPVPGVAVRVVDPETRELLEPEREGLLEVKGPSVMMGYLDDPERTAEVLRDGWYATGDVARLDRDGFLTLTDRLARFSKIGGEMVPHARVEEALASILQRMAGAGSDEGPELAVTSLPDPRKGEQLVVLHTSLPCSVTALLQEAGKEHLPALFVPRERNFLQVEAIPKLGTGKTDLRGLRRVAESELAPRAAP